MNPTHLNQDHWNKKVPVHLKSEFYNHQAFLDVKSSLQQIELDLLGDISEKRILHLQCHFGQDSISLSRMGAEVTGVDFSEAAIGVAKKTAKDLNVSTKFICCNIFDLPNHLDETFDIVFASYGVICWHPDLEKFVNLVSKYLKSGGRFVFVEFHPTMWMWNDEFTEVAYSYFNREAIFEEYEGTYAEHDSKIKSSCYVWNHSLADMIGNLVKKGFNLTSFEEFDYSPYPIFADMTQTDSGHQVKGFEGKMPMLYALKAKKA